MKIIMSELENIKKILIFRLCCFGDVIMLTPAISAFKEQYPGAEIKIAASKWIEKLLPYISGLNGAIIFDGPFEKNIFKKTLSTIRLILKLRKEKFDLVFLAHRKSMFGLILKLAGIKFRLGFSETKFLTNTYKYDNEIHFVDRHSNVLTNCGINVKSSNLELKPVNKKSDILKKYKLEKSSSIIGIFPFGGSNPGTEMNIKRWDLNKYIVLIAKIARNHPERTVVLFEGTLEDEKIATSGLPENVIKMTIDPELISICNIFISGDTGPLYMAEGFSVSTLSVFGPTDAVHVAPKSSSENVFHRYIWKKPYCSPCYTDITAFDRKNPKYWKGNNFICNTGTHDCVKSITVDEVKKELDVMISELSKKQKVNS